MTELRLSCVLKQVVINEYLSVLGIPVDDGIVATIPPGKTIGYECPINKALDEMWPILQTTIRIDANYKTLGYGRTTESELFNWDIHSRHWTSGEIIN